MSKKVLVDRIRDQFPSKSAAEVAVEIVVAGIAAEVRENGKVALPDFGTFERKRSEERTGRNPRTGEQVKIAARDRVAFRSRITL